jgi:hypothetical protein
MNVSDCPTALLSIANVGFPLPSDCINAIQSEVVVNGALGTVIVLAVGLYTYAFEIMRISV